MTARIRQTAGWCDAVLHHMVISPRDEAIDKALAFRALHRDGVLTLPNAWDVASARIVERAGAAAIATTSAGVAWSLGAPDGDRLPVGLMLEAVARIAAAVTIPVTADIESGYADTADGVSKTVRGVIDAGAVGINLEDTWHGGDTSLRPVADQVERVVAARRAADETDVALFVNARVDTYLLGVGDPANRLSDTVTRASAYVDAGADGVFVPGVTDVATIGKLAAEIPAPLNIMVGQGAPSVPDLARLGVVRVSAGAAIALASYAVVRRAAEELLTSGEYGQLAAGLDYGQLNELLATSQRLGDT